MNEWTRAARRMAFWSALTVVLLGVAYVATGAVWLLSGGAQAPDPLEPAEPFLTILELLLFLSVPALVILMAAVHSYAETDRKTLSLAALAFTIMFAVLTCGVHFVQLTVARQGITLPHPGHWPTVALALDLLAWDLFLGLALLFAAPVFRGGKLEKAIRVGMTVSGALCVAGTLGPASGEMRFQFMAITGYAAGVPIVCVLLAKLFARRDASTGASA